MGGVTAQADREVPIVGSQDPKKILDTLLYLLVAHNGPGRGSLEACEGRGSPPARRGKVRNRSRFWATCLHRCLKVLEPRGTVSRSHERKGLKDLGELPKAGVQGSR